MPETLVPKSNGRGTRVGRERERECETEKMKAEKRACVGVKVARAIAPLNHMVCLKVLHRETKRIKLKITEIITSEFTDENQIFNKRSGNKSVSKKKRIARKKGITVRYNGHLRTVTNNNMLRNRTTII